jgi:glycosyltransferase involved in cell wall biosynthesis
MFDTKNLKDIDAEILNYLQENNVNVYFLKSSTNSFGYDMINYVIGKINNGWIYILDDDNIMHPEFYTEIINSINTFDSKIFVFNQQVDGKDFTKLDIRLALPDNMKLQGVDIAQVIFNRSILKYDFDLDYKADGYMIEKLYSEYPEEFLFINKIICYYNFLQTDFSSNPRILVVGTSDNIELKSNQLVDYESKELKVKCVENDENIDEVITSYNPDSIVTIGESFGKYQNLCKKSLDVRKRWIHKNEIDESTGEYAYQTANNYILDTDDKNTPLVSFFTPIYNTGDKLRRTYGSVKSQSYTNWEWIIVNDSTDGGKTLKIAESISKLDCRVKVYDFRRKSGGIVGESKYRAATLCSGEWIMELDHDDYLTCDAAYWMVEAFKAHPESMFVYSDCAEIWENHQSITYGDGFSFGYGSYRDEVYNGITYKAMNTSNINSKTIRHIVGVPNHFRAWNRKFYYNIGGHNRRLTIADDYELIVRTFLNTKMVRIPKMLYLQFYHQSNTQDKTRSDIQRRVKSISNFYNERIHQRFLELGATDWAYDENPHNPLITPSRFGSEESEVNLVFKEKKLNPYYNA